MFGVRFAGELEKWESVAMVENVGFGDSEKFEMCACKNLKGWSVGGKKTMLFTDGKCPCVFDLRCRERQTTTSSRNATRILSRCVLSNASYLRMCGIVAILSDFGGSQKVICEGGVTLAFLNGATTRADQIRLDTLSGGANYQGPPFQISLLGGYSGLTGNILKLRDSGC